MKAKALAILTTMVICLSFVAAVTPSAAGPVLSDTWYTNPGDSVQYAIDIASPRDSTTPSIQLAVLLDGSGSMSSAEWNVQIYGLHDAIIDPYCIPDHYVELTVIQFAENLEGGARTEIGPIVITDSNRDDVATDVLNIIHAEGTTPIEAGIYLALYEITNSTNFASAQKQIINISSDIGLYVVNFNLTRWARNNAILYGIDEISAEGIGDIRRPTDINWLRDYIVWPQPGTIATPFTPGWVYDVGLNAGMFKEAICHKITGVLSPPPTPTPTPTPTTTPTPTPTPTPTTPTPTPITTPSPSPTPTGPKFKCFIATAAYGTSSAPEIDTLRAFRDEVLLESTLGSQLVDWYYQTSPPVADFISDHEGLRTLVRDFLVDPIAWVVEATETLWQD